jgi:transketolase
MRREFHPLLLAQMRNNPQIMLITADLGYKMWDNIAAEFPDRFINCGASEQLMLGIGVGMALEGLIPVCYSITPFLLKRPYEWIDNYLEHEQIPVKLLGGGRGTDYAHDGYSHDASKDLQILDTCPNIARFIPESVSQLPEMVHAWLHHTGPAYLNLKR